MPLGETEALILPGVQGTRNALVSSVTSIVASASNGAAGRQYHNRFRQAYGKESKSRLPCSIIESRVSERGL
jgi:hypothetical protein